eukprot:TRINITY_DN16490_c0_g1_i1.p2 TRINITY_DN16490_c0_g1~~TRINITY_DN16490_c0_g1_i1.p2  ORF type:complete len:314 (+),score=64.77 TRINITY_DN16490_c0_g1_i1:59-1000(+)
MVRARAAVLLAALAPPAAATGDMTADVPVYMWVIVGVLSLLIVVIGILHLLLGRFKKRVHRRQPGKLDKSTGSRSPAEKDIEKGLMAETPRAEKMPLNDEDDEALVKVKSLNMIGSRRVSEVPPPPPSVRGVSDAAGPSFKDDPALSVPGTPRSRMPLCSSWHGSANFSGRRSGWPASPSASPMGSPLAFAALTVPPMGQPPPSPRRKSSATPLQLPPSPRKKPSATPTTETDRVERAESMASFTSPAGSSAAVSRTNSLKPALTAAAVMESESAHDTLFAQSGSPGIDPLIIPTPRRKSRPLVAQALHSVDL